MCVGERESDETGGEEGREKEGGEIWHENEEEVGGIRGGLKKVERKDSKQEELGERDGDTEGPP